MTGTMYAHQVSKGVKTSNTLTVLGTHGVVTSLEVWGAILCFQAGGGWVVLAVLLAFFAIGTFANMIGTIVDILSA